MKQKRLPDSGGVVVLLLRNGLNKRRKIGEHVREAYKNKKGQGVEEKTPKTVSTTTQGGLAMLAIKSRFDVPHSRPHDLQT